MNKKFSKEYAVRQHVISKIIKSLRNEKLNRYLL